MWEKYGTAITMRTNYNDPTTKQPPKVNIYNRPARPTSEARASSTASSPVACIWRSAQVSTRAYAGVIAMTTGQNRDGVR